MNASKIIISIVMFLLLISLIPVIFNLSSGFMLAELIVFIVLLVIGTIAVFRLLSGDGLKFMFCLYIIHIINIFVIYTRTFDLSSVIISIILVLIGLYAAVFGLNNDGDSEIEPYYEESHEVEVKEEKPKKAKKKKKSK